MTVFDSIVTPSWEELAQITSIDKLINFMKSHKDASVRQGAARRLGVLANASAIDSLVVTLSSDGNDYVRSEAAKALGEIGGSSAIDPLISAWLNDKDYKVRINAARSLAKLRSSRAVEHFIAELRDRGKFGNEGNLEAACVALEVIGTPVIPSLLAALKASVQTDNWWFTRVILLLLCNLGDASTIGPLENLLQGWPTTEQQDCNRSYVEEAIAVSKGVRQKK